MSVDKISNAVDISGVPVVSNTHARKQSVPEPQPHSSGDSVSIGHSKGTESVNKVSWPPFFPIGDAQGIFKIGK